MCILYHIMEAMVRLQGSGCSARPRSLRFIECWAAFVRENSAELMRRAELKFQPTDPLWLASFRCKVELNLTLAKHQRRLCYLFSHAEAARGQEIFHLWKFMHVWPLNKSWYLNKRDDGPLFSWMFYLWCQFSCALQHTGVMVLCPASTYAKYCLTPYQVNLCLLFIWFLVSPKSDLLPNKRARLREVPEDEESSSLSSFTALSASCSSAKQRTHRRCHFCRTKLELVQQEMGSCRCGTWIQLYAESDL